MPSAGRREFFLWATIVRSVFSGVNGHVTWVLDASISMKAVSKSSVMVAKYSWKTNESLVNGRQIQL